MKKRKKSLTTKNTKRNHCSVKQSKDYNPFISIEQANNNTAAVQKLIDTMKRYNDDNLKNGDLQYLKGLKIGWTGQKKVDDYIIERIYKEVIPVSKLAKTVTEIQSCGTASSPKYNQLWVIGFFGSIWLDIELDNSKYRVSFYNNNPYPTIAIAKE